MTKIETLPMDVMCEMASDIVNYIWFTVLHHADHYDHTIEDENGDFVYREEAQDIFNAVLDHIDNVANPET